MERWNTDLDMRLFYTLLLCLLAPLAKGAIFANEFTTNESGAPLSVQAKTTFTDKVTNLLGVAFNSGLDSYGDMSIQPPGAQFSWQTAKTTLAGTGDGYWGIYLGQDASLKILEVSSNGVGFPLGILSSAITITNDLTLSSLNSQAGVLYVANASGPVHLLQFGSGLQVLRVNSGATDLEFTTPVSTGTNYPPVISNGGGKAASTNVTVGLGVRQSLVIMTNASFKLVFTGTPLNGESLKITVSNLSTTVNVYVTNTVKFAAWASNVTVWPTVASNSFSVFNLVAETNLNTGTMEWVMESDFGKEMEFRVDGASGGGFLVLSTNSPATYITISNTYPPQGASAHLSNEVAIASIVPYTNTLVAGWGLVLTTNSGVVTATPTNRPASIATNATSATLDFSDAVNVNIYNTWFHLTTNLVLSPTNLIVGRTIAVWFPTNSLTYDVVITNTAATPIRWNFNVATNGSTSFTKTNAMEGQLFLTAQTNGVITADFRYYR